MRVAMTGSTGLVGSELTHSLRRDGVEVCPVVRRAAVADAEIHWDIPAGTIEREKLEGVDAVVHLAGENIAGHRWTEDFKRRVLESRREGTRLLCEAIASLERPPKVLISASGIGYYGDRGSESLTETSGPGSGFLPEVCRAWEGATAPIGNTSVRLVILRFGAVLSPKGGALAQMLLPFKLGLGGVLGSGKQYFSWISLHDLVRAIRFCIERESCSGRFNATSPFPVTNHKFTRTLGSILFRPTYLPVPAFALRMVLGQMADELLLASARVIPEKLLEQGFTFDEAELDTALQNALKR